MMCGWRFKFFAFCVSEALLIAFFILSPVIGQSVADERLAGRWAMSGYGVGYTGGYGEVFVLILGADGNAVMERTEGCMIVTEPATWKSDGQVVRFVSAKEPEWPREGGYTYSVDGKRYRVNSWPNRDYTCLYSVDGDILTLHMFSGDETSGEKMLLTRKD